MLASLEESKNIFEIGPDQGRITRRHNEPPIEEWSTWKKAQKSPE
jgi:hypothetical protein